VKIAIAGATGRMGRTLIEAVLADQFDAYVWFEESRAVTPLGPERPHGVPETWPFGL